VSETSLPPVIFDLTSVDGNAYNLMGSWVAAARKARWPKAEIDRIRDEAMSGDYNHLIVTLMGNSSDPETAEDDDDECDDENGCDQ
jgi:hypothetical protein